MAGGEVPSSIETVRLTRDQEFDASDFVPLFRNPDAQTILSRYFPARLDPPWPTESRIFQTSDDVRVLADVNRPTKEPAPGVLVAVHGLTGSSRTGYMLNLARAALETGLEVVRLNVRNCGGTEHLCRTLYHSGLTGDLRSVVEQLAPRPVVLAGFSMGGNMVLKLAGEWGESPPSHVRGVCGISVPIQLADCVRQLSRPRNRIYELRFLRALMRVVRRKQRLQPELFSWLHPNGIRSIYELDNAITAPAFGFRDADDYYARASSEPYLSRIRVPALLIQAQDDPFIPFSLFGSLNFAANAHLRLAAPQHGGHIAFLARGNPRFWAHHRAVRFAGELFEG